MSTGFFNEYFNEYYNEYFDNAGGVPSGPSFAIPGNPILVIAPMTDTWLNSGTAPNRLSLLIRKIVWDAPQNNGDVLRIEDGNGGLLFQATAKAGVSKSFLFQTAHHRGMGIRWRDFIVTVIGSGQLYVFYTT